MEPARQQPIARGARLRALLCATSAVLASCACNREAPPGEAHGPSDPSGTAVGVQAGNPTLPTELAPRPSAVASAAPAIADAGAADAGYNGPLFAVTSIAAAVYAQPQFENTDKLGYVRNGGRVPIDPKPVSTKNCSGGWYHILEGGYVCGNQGTTDMNHPQVRFAIKQPMLDDVLPYQYARNAKNGTPLYKSVPSRDQMNKYEPYLASAKKAKKHAESDADEHDEATTVEASSKAGRDGGAPDRQKIDQALADAGVAVGAGNDAGDPEADKPWWQKDDKDKLHELTLQELTADSDDVLAKRMVAGFYIAVDKLFMWNGRSWYKTTKGLVAPADRFWVTAGYKYKGIELGTDWKLPIAWVYGGRKTAPTYKLDDTQHLKPAEAVESFKPIQLTGREQEFNGEKYNETQSGTWIKSAYLRITRPGPPPKDLAAGERWVDVNLTEQTVVAFEGTTARYATLISSGKESKVKDKDHSTPTGEWRIREKHITTTMDGDGTAAGDLPYSIEDVPYVEYFLRSYALHGAFWHRNFGIEMSHGCVNLAPLDAKWLFFFTEPRLPQGWHGIWATKDRPGSRVVIHG